MGRMSRKGDLSKGVHRRTEESGDGSGRTRLRMAIPRTPESAERKKRQHRRRHRLHVWKDKHYRWVPDGNGDWRVQAYIYRHHHKPKRGHFRGPGKKPARRASAAAAAAPLNPDPRPAGAYQGPFGVEQATRLINRAGF